MSDYCNKNMKGLARQLLLNPPSVRHKHADRIEAFLLDLDPDRVYAMDFVYYRITGFRPSELPVETIRGEELHKDLQKMLEEVSASSPIPVQQVPEKVYSIRDVAARYHVTERTAYRWRDKGLVTRKYKFERGRERIGVRQESLRQFVSENAELVDKSARFSTLSDEEKRDIRARCDRIQEETDLSVTAVAEQIAHEVERAPETVRRVMTEARRQNHPSDQPGRTKLTLNDKKQIYRQYDRGESVQDLSDRYDRSRSSIYRIVNQQRARELIHKISQLPEEQETKNFRTTERDQILQPEEPVSERCLFRLYHYLKCRMQNQVEEIDPTRYVSTTSLDTIASQLEIILRIRRKLLEQCIPTIFETARQHRGPEVGFADLVDEGCVCMLICIERFNYRREGTFSRFLRLELMKNFARTVPSTNYRVSTTSSNQTPVRPDKEELGQAVAFAARRLRNFDFKKIEVEKLRQTADLFDLSPAPTAEILQSIVAKYNLERPVEDAILQTAEEVTGGPEG